MALSCGATNGAERATGRESLTLDDLDDGCTSAAAGEGFVSTEIGYEGNRFWADFDATPSENSMDAVIGFSDGPADAFADLGVAVRFNPDGFIDARDGDAYRVHDSTTLAYHAGQTYRFHVEVDLGTRTYQATVSSPDGFSWLAFEAAFRTNQAAALQSTHRVSMVDSASGSVSVCNYSRPYGDRCVRTDAGGGWNNRQFWPITGTGAFFAQVKPTESNVDAVVGISQGAADGFGDLAAIVRFNPEGAVDARNGNAYAAAAPLSYSGGNTYDVELSLDVRQHTYSATVGGAAIAQGFAFRGEQSAASQLDGSAVFIDSPSGGLIVCNDALSSTDRAIYTVPSAFGQLAVGANGPLYEMHGSEIVVRDAGTGVVVSSAPRRGTGRLDRAGNLYLAGTFDDDYDPGTGTLTSAGGKDVFVAKYAPDLTALWARPLGTAADDDLIDMVVDGQGDAVVLGATLGTVVLDANGDVTRQSEDAASDIATNAAGELALIGSERSEAGTRIWVEKRSRDGAALWRKNYLADEVSGVAISDAGDVAFSGRFRGTVNFGGADLQFHASEVPSAGYVAKLTSSGEHQWSLLTDHHEFRSYLAVDPGGNVVSGATIGSQYVEAAITKFASADGSRLWAQAETVRGRTGSIAVDASGAVYWSFSHEDYAQGTTESFVKKLSP
jgi:hypothetical protein